MSSDTHWEALVRAEVDKAPPLTPAKRTRLALLMSTPEQIPARPRKIKYSSAHNRVRTARGPARDHLCATGCGRPAAEWAYLGGDPAELHEPARGAYSADPSYYQPECIPCHRRVDARLK